MINFRIGTFETNSSSVHSLILCNSEDYDRWMEGELLLNYYYNDNWAWRHWDSEAHKYVETTKGTPPQFVTEEQAAYYDENYPYPEVKEDSWGNLALDFKDKNGKYHERKFLTFEEFRDGAAADFETFCDSYITPKGEEVIGFGFFGRDG